MDNDTLQFYRNNAQSYAARPTHNHTRLHRFLALLPPGGSILELGCGAGHHSAEMHVKGFKVHPTDGSPEMASEASHRLGRPVATLLFQDLSDVESYDGIWASACLLHVPRSDLIQILARIWRALKPAGYFYASFKAGDAEGRDTLNRYYNFPSEDWLKARYADAGRWKSFSIETSENKGFDNELATMMHIVVQKDSVATGLTQSGK